MLRITIRTFVRCAGSSRRVGDCATFGGSDPLLTFQTKNFAVTSFGHQPEMKNYKKYYQTCQYLYTRRYGDWEESIFNYESSN